MLEKFHFGFGSEQRKSLTVASSGKVGVTLKVMGARLYFTVITELQDWHTIYFMALTQLISLCYTTATTQNVSTRGIFF
jgi:hypothetical protein